MPLQLGVVGVQGDVREHVTSLERALEAEDLAGEAGAIRSPEALQDADGVVLPGGESTTISRLLHRFDLRDRLRTRVLEEDLPVMGTCAGMILLASDGDEQVDETDTTLLELVDIRANRNYFGGQRESFQYPIPLPGLDDPFEAIFIRAPVAEDVWGEAEVLARLPAEGATAARRDPADEAPVVAAEQGNRVVYAFHPELTGDLRLHRRFVRRVRSWKAPAAEAVQE